MVSAARTLLERLSVRWPCFSRDLRIAFLRFSISRSWLSRSSYGSNSDFVQAAGGFFSVTGDKRDGGTFFQKIGYRLNVIVAYVLLPGDFGCECVVVHDFFDLSFGKTSVLHLRVSPHWNNSPSEIIKSFTGVGPSDRTGVMLKNYPRNINYMPACPACPVKPLLLSFHRGRSVRSYWGGYFFRMPLQGVGPTLRPVSPTGWKRGRRLDLEQKSSFMDGH